MNLFWLFLIIPGYAFMGGLVRAIVHNTLPGHNKRRCEKWEDFPCVMWAGWAWPVMFPFLILAACARLGSSAESLRPARRREIRDKKIKALEWEHGINQR